MKELHSQTAHVMILLAACVLVLAACAESGIVNGDFETLPPPAVPGWVQVGGVVEGAPEGAGGGGPGFQSARFTDGMGVALLGGTFRGAAIGQDFECDPVHYDTCYITFDYNHDDLDPVASTPFVAVNGPSGLGIAILPTTDFVPTTVTVGYPDCDDLTIYFGIVKPVPPAVWNAVFYLDNVEDTCCACEPDPPPIFTEPYPAEPDSTEQAIYELVQQVIWPTPVRLTGFRAMETDEGVSIDWSYLVQDLDNAGFNLYRSVDESDDYHLLNTDGLLVGESPFRYVDGNVQPGHTYSYMLGAVDLWGVEVKFGPVTACWMGLSAKSGLLACYPTPTTGSTTISYRLKSAGYVDLSVYDSQGRLVRTLVREVAGPGSQDVTWDGCDNDGRKVSAGVYHCTLKVNGLEDSKKITLIE